MAGDRIEVNRGQDGRWHFLLYPSHSPHGAIARSRERGYASPSAAKRAAKSALGAAAFAWGDGSKPRIFVRSERRVAIEARAISRIP
jgi:hypothetical protein